MKNYYEILEVDMLASSEEIRHAYLTKIKQYHPDTYEGSIRTAEKMTSQINEAYSTLKDYGKRKDYNRKQGLETQIERLERERRQDEINTKKKIEKEAKREKRRQERNLKKQLRREYKEHRKKVKLERKLNGEKKLSRREKKKAVNQTVETFERQTAIKGNAQKIENEKKIEKENANKEKLIMDSIIIVLLVLIVVLIILH